MRWLTGEGMEKQPRLLASQLFLKNSVFEVLLNGVLLTWKEIPANKKVVSGSIHHPFKVGSTHSVSVSEILAARELDVDGGTKDDGRWQKMPQKLTEAYPYAFTVSYVEKSEAAPLAV